MNKIFIKQISVLSLILGAVLGVITIIPYIGLIAFLTAMFATAVIVLIYMKKNNFIGKLTPKDGALFGAIIGFISCLGFCLTLVPLAAIIAFINHLWFHKLTWYSSMGLWFINGISGFMILLMMVFFVATLSALMNAFSGLATVYFYDQFLNEEENATFHIDS